MDAASFGKRFNNFAQWTMQKLGQAEETKLDPEFEARVAKFHSTKKELMALFKTATQFHAAKLKLQKANEGFHDALAMTASHAKASPEAVSATQSYVTAGRQLDTEESKFVDVYKVQVVDAIKGLLDKEVKECESVLKQHSSAHLDYDACNRKWKKMEKKGNVPTAKKTALQEELKKKAKTFNDLGHQVVNLTAIVDSKKNTILHENLEKYMSAQQQYFEKASKYMLDGDNLKTKLEAARASEEDGVATGEKKETKEAKEDTKETKTEV
eukprot:CAMPEP_0184483988 /NCGR_PEP_ID=MMETSP0113_2-20130426/5690_1 /TAXON_ID=91329 /ORGANISM="Norrisiella sphaerica, Strain BC52" /LENGTH=268 /DNA_ID=CAMNT_0026864719 /DNA_START=104 /DNA_END=910 /DNA_ORIENTATION=+